MEKWGSSLSDEFIQIAAHIPQLTLKSAIFIINGRVSAKRLPGIFSVSNKSQIDADSRRILIWTLPPAMNPLNISLLEAQPGFYWINYKFLRDLQNRASMHHERRFRFINNSPQIH